MFYSCISDACSLCLCSLTANHGLFFWLVRSPSSLWRKLSLLSFPHLYSAVVQTNAIRTRPMLLMLVHPILYFLISYDQDPRILKHYFAWGSYSFPLGQSNPLMSIPADCKTQILLPVATTTQKSQTGVSNRAMSSRKRKSETGSLGGCQHQL